MFAISTIGIFVTIVYKAVVTNDVSSVTTFLSGISANQSPPLEGISPPEGISIPVNCDPSP